MRCYFCHDRTVERLWILSWHENRGFRPKTRHDRILEGASVLS